MRCMLTKIEHYPRDDVLQKGDRYYKYLCECGQYKIIREDHVISGDTSSCGCHRKIANVTHGDRSKGVATSRYSSWANMIQRCSNTKIAAYAEYGGRGITVCEQWLASYEKFAEDMGDCPEGCSLDRIDVNGNYNKENCRWATDSEQAFNIRKRVANRSGRTGVCWHKSSGKWIAQISYRREHIYLGIYDSFEEAVKVREAAELKYFGFIKE